MNNLSIELIKRNDFFELKFLNDTPLEYSVFSHNSEVSHSRDRIPFDLIKDSSKPQVELTIKIGCDDILIRNRHIQVEGLLNLRDMGGYQTNDGSRVKWNKLFRSDQLSNLTKDSISYLKTKKIHTIYDFRSEGERNKYPNMNIDEYETIFVNPKAETAAIAAQIHASKVNEMKALVESTKALISENNISGDEVMIKQYVNFVTDKKSQSAYAAMLKNIVNNAGAPLLQHCRGGKDRTGFGAALLLLVLGVREQDIIYDYMLTEGIRRNRNLVKINHYREYTSNEKVIDYLSALDNTKPIYIQSAIDTINQQFGGIDNYVTKVLEISLADVDLLKENYLQ